MSEAIYLIKRAGRAETMFSSVAQNGCGSLMNYSAIRGSSKGENERDRRRKRHSLYGNDRALYRNFNSSK